MNELWEFLYNFFDYPTVQGLVSGIIATIVGVALGIPVAFWINRLGEARTEKEKKTKILGVLLDELEQIKLFIYAWNNRREKFRFLTPQAVSMSDETWRAFSDGGELQWIRDPSLLQQLSKTYAQVKHVRFISESMWVHLDSISIVNIIFVPAIINGTGMVLKQNMDILESSVIESIVQVKENLE